jgi:glycosyltransferase involved in cell wall biosynthesis
VYVLNDGSTDNTVQIAKDAGFDVTQFPSQSSVSNRDGINQMARHVSSVIESLLQKYECALFNDVDDFVVPTNGGSLKEFMDSFALGSKNFYTFEHLAIVQDTNTECKLILNDPWLTQRKNAVNVPKFNNPLLWKIKPSWSRGFHYAYGCKPDPDGEAYSIDTHMIDFDLCNERHINRGKINNVNYNTNEEIKKYMDTQLHNRYAYGSQMTLLKKVPEEIKLLIP